jgi:hypothetical protein
MRPRVYLFIVAAAILSASRPACPQAIIRLSPDGSLVIQDRSGTSQRPLSHSNVIELVGSQMNDRVRHGSSGWGQALPVISKGRGSGRSQPGPAPAQPSTQFGPQSTPVPDTPISSLIDKTAQEHGVDPSLVRLVVQNESGFNPRAVSPKGAMGLMQLMPGTASLLGVQDPFNPAQNIAGGIRYLKQCLERFDNNVCLALAAYNAGPENVAKYQGVPPFAETRKYVANIMQEYRGQAVELPGPPSIIPVRQAATARAMPQKTALAPADLQSLFLPGGDRVKVFQSGKSKIIEIFTR